MMKKLLAMTAIAAMAFGAQAGVTYSYQFSLVTIPTAAIDLYKTDGIKNVKCYLCDNGSTAGSAQYKGKALMAEFKLDSIDKPTDDSVRFNYTAKTFDSTGKETDETVTYATSGYDKFGNVDIATLNTKQKIEWKDMGDDNYAKSSSEYMDSLNHYVDKNLEAILVADVYDEELKTYVSKAFSVGVDLNSGYVGLGSNTSYSAVPEPTSSMFVLLGLAGLALKRKRAA